LGGQGLLSGQSKHAVCPGPHSDQLPAIYMRESRRVSQSFLFTQRFNPKLVMRSGPADKLDDPLPDLFGFVRTTLKSSALAEMQIWSGGKTVAPGSSITASDSTEAEGWSREALVDGYASGAEIVDWPDWLAGLSQRREAQHELAALEAQWRTEQAPADITVVRGDPMSQGSSLSSFGRALRLRMGVHDGEARESQVQKVRTYLNQRLPRPVRFLAGFLGELVGVAFPDDGDEQLRAARGSASIMQARMRMAVEAFVRSQADVAPQVFVLEDAQWADETTLDLVDALLGCKDLRFAAFVFARPELDLRHPQLWGRKNVTRLALAPLSPASSERMVAAALPHASPTLRTSIVERAGGNALFLEELVRSVHSMGLKPRA